MTEEKHTLSYEAAASISHQNSGDRGAPVVSTINGVVMADSRDVAATFGKQHQHVLEAYRRLHCSDEFRQSNFRPIKINDLKGESTSHVMMTKNGFAFLALGFTGERAALFKERYIERFDAMEATLRAGKGFLADMVPGILAEALSTLLPGMIEKHLEADERAVAVGYKPALTVLVDKKVPTRKRRAFSQKVSSRLRRFSTANGHPMRISRESGRYLFHIDAINGWLASEGEGLIRDHVAALNGQGSLRLVTTA